MNMYRKASGVGEGREAWGRRRLGGRHVVFAVEFRFLGSFWKKNVFTMMLRERKKKHVWKSVRKLLFWKVILCLSLAIAVRFFSSRPKFQQRSPQ